MDYEPIDLTHAVNRGRDLRPDLPAGPCTFRGLPFDVTSAGLVVLDGASVRVPVGKAARRVLFAHVLLGDANPPRPGRSVGRYVVRYGDGSEEPVLIRERFEIHYEVVGWGQSPFVAVGDRHDGLYDRDRGRWDDAGFRQTEASQGGREHLWLYAWTNPRPDAVIESIGLEGERVLVGAITLGHAGEEPFVREGRRDVRITVDRDVEARIDVDVDRGMATYAYPVPVGDAVAGWGRPNASDRRLAYTRVAATPSATVSVRSGGEVLGAVRWGDVLRDGAASQPPVRVELVDAGRNWVHVTVVDDGTGRPVPCRVRFESPSGVPYQPHGHHDHVNSDIGTWHVDVGGDVRLGATTYAYIDGRCQGWLPRGDVVVDVARGFEYNPLRTTVRVEPGQRELTLRLKRWTDMSSRGWWSGDSHVHFLSTVGSLLEQRGEDLNVVNLLQSQWGHLFTNTEEFTGRPHASDDGRYVTWVGSENRQHVMGHMSLWGLREPVMPWCSDGPSEAELGGTIEATLSDWADRAHAQGATVILPHFPNPNGEPATLVATGRVDAVEMLVQDPWMHGEYYGYLRCGYRLPLVGGTDKMTADVPVGLYRTYANLRDEEFSFHAWRRAVVEGRTFLSGGPMIGVEVDGLGPGDTLRTAGPGTVEVHAWAESIFPVHTLEIVRDGEVVAAATSSTGERRLELRERVRVGANAWIAARTGGESYFGGRPHLDGWGRRPFAHTSPVYVACGSDEWRMFDREHASYMLTLVDGSLEHIRRVALHDPDERVTRHHGEPDHLAWLERPFLQAREAITRRVERP